MRAPLLFYVSGHGYGHVTRCVAVLRALRALDPDAPLLARTEAPAWLFEEADADVEVSSAPIDVGMLQSNGLDIDLDATLAAHERFLAGWDQAVTREAEFIRLRRPALVVGDMPALAFAAAAAAGVPAAALGNFSWDWILDYYAARDPRWRPAAQRYRAAYSSAAELLRLPMHGDFPAFAPDRITDLPIAVSRSRLSPSEARAAVGAEDSRPRVLLSFGGFGAGELDLGRGDDLADFVFVGFGPKPRGLKAQWKEFPRKTPVPHVDILAGCDAVIGKPGFGTFAEAVAHKKPMLYLPRADFPEVPRLLAWMERHGRTVLLPREDFYAGRWRAALGALLGVKRAFPEARCDGAELAAARLLERARRAR